MKNAIGFMTIVVLVVAVLFSGVILHFATKSTVVFTVEHRERVLNSNRDGSRYMIWGETNGTVEVFENTDSVLALKWNSADVYGMMSVGAVCEATVTGIRVPMLSWNRNILRANCVRADTQG
jgi:hypothetical protein